MWTRRRRPPLTAGGAGAGARFPSSSLRDLFSPPCADSAVPVLHRTRSASSALRNLRCSPAARQNAVPVVLYFTSLRAVRRTFDDCRAVRAALRGLGVAADERDVSMDSSFLAELHSLSNAKRSKISLPQLFINGVCVGGAEDVRRLHESGELRQLLLGAPRAANRPCSACQGIRFVICEACDGRHSVYSDKAGGFRTCELCNENGLVRCAACSAPWKLNPNDAALWP